MKTIKGKAKVKKVAKKVEPVVVAFKGFSKNWQCRGFQYVVGQSYEHKGEVEACSSGFHSCENPLDVFGYYAPGGSKFAIIEASGKIARDGGDTKIASASINIKAEIFIPEIVTEAIAWVTSLCTSATAQHATGYQSASLTIGNFGASEVLKISSQSVAIGVGYQNKAKAAEGCAIVLCYRDDEYKIVHIRASKVGENGIEADKWYSLNERGEFVQV